MGILSSNYTATIQTYYHSKHSDLKTLDGGLYELFGSLARDAWGTRVSAA